MLALLLGTLCLIKFNNFSGKYEGVGEFRGAILEKDIWNPMIAETVNNDTLALSIDSRKYTNQDVNIFMDDNLNIMVPVSILSDGLNCSSHIYDGARLLVEKRNDEVSLSLDQEEYSVNGNVVKTASAMKDIDGEYYVSIAEVSKGVGYSYEWNVEDNMAKATDVSESTSILPAKYDLREKGRVSVIKNQGATGTCWAFAALSALESELLPEENLILSPDHMSQANGFKMTQEDGGEYTMGMAYLLSWQGPVLEKDDPFGDGVTNNQLTPVKHVQEVQMIEGKDYEKIKEGVFKYGGVQTALYSTLRSSSVSSEFYNGDANAYCYMGTEKPNHEVVIIGWDDSFPKENFPVNVEGDGAFICQNSWGSNFGEQGVFYVSYYDTNIGSHNIVYTDVEETDNYDTIYQSDICGWVGQVGYNKSSIYGANTYTAEQDQEIRSAGFYATGKDTDYAVYFVNNFENTDSFGSRIKVAEGSFSNAGYYTVEFSKAMDVAKGEKFAVIIYLNTPSSVHPLAVEYEADEATSYVDLSDGEGYISTSGRNWENVETTSSCNLCIKAYADDK